MNAVLEKILSRRSIRQYTAEPVSEADLELMLMAAMSAPSSWNQQPWHFIVIDDKEMLKFLGKRDSGWGPLGRAPLAILVVGGPGLVTHDTYWIQDSSAAVENLLLAAHSLGLGAVWCGLYPEEGRTAFVNEHFPLPDGLVPVALIAVGHPAEQHTLSSRYKPERIHHNRWGQVMEPAHGLVATGG
jgi:nitroreductase